MRTAPASVVALLLVASSPALARDTPRAFEPLAHLAPPVPSETYGVAITEPCTDCPYFVDHCYVIDGYYPFGVPSEGSPMYRFFRVNHVTRAPDLVSAHYYPRTLVLDGKSAWPAPWGVR